MSGNDLLQFWEDDDDTDVVLLYLESFGNPRKFTRIARRLSRRKPIVAVKAVESRPRLASRLRPDPIAGPPLAGDATIGAMLASPG